MFAPRYSIILPPCSSWKLFWIGNSEKLYGKKISVPGEELSAGILPPRSAGTKLQKQNAFLSSPGTNSSKAFTAPNSRTYPALSGNYLPMKSEKCRRRSKERRVGKECVSTCKS